MAPKSDETPWRWTTGNYATRELTIEVIGLNK
jgi:hypothetical protein